MGPKSRYLCLLELWLWELGGEVQSPAEAEPSHTTGRHTLLPVVWKATTEHEPWRAFLCTFCTEPLHLCKQDPTPTQWHPRRWDEPRRPIYSDIQIFGYSDIQ